MPVKISEEHKQALDLLRTDLEKMAKKRGNGESEDMSLNQWIRVLKIRDTVDELVRELLDLEA